MRFLFILSLPAILFADHFLTFIVPCYNCEQWVEESIESILDQKNLNCPFEIVCTDDGSKDGTYSLLCSLRKKHPEMRVFQHEKNQGGGACRNTCVSQAQGDLIFCLDSDNVLAPNSVQTLIDHLDRSGDDAVAFGEAHYFRETREVSGKSVYQLPEEKVTLQQVLQETETPPWSGNYLYTKKSFTKAGGYPTDVNAMDTYAFGFLQLMNGCKMSYVPGTFYLHRHGIDSYYVRESAARRLTKVFCTFLLAHKKLFTRKTVKLLNQQLDLANQGKPGKDQIALLKEKKLQLK